MRRDLLSSSFNGLLVLVPGMGRLVGAGPPVGGDAIAEPPRTTFGNRGEQTMENL